MKFTFGIVLLVLLNTACGGKNSKNNKGVQQHANSQQSFTPQQVQSGPELGAHNKLTAPTEWVAHDGERFLAIGRMDKNEIKNLAADLTDVPVLAGTLSAIWEVSIYPETFEDGNPKPIVTSTEKTYPELRVYFAQSSDNSNEVWVVVQKENSEKLSGSQTPTKISYDYGMVCTGYLLMSERTLHPEKFPVNGADMTLDFSNSVASCYDIDHCTLPLNDRAIPISRDDLLRKYPYSKCRTQARLPKQVTDVNNSVRITSYKILIDDSLKTRASALRF